MLTRRELARMRLAPQIGRTHTPPALPPMLPLPLIVGSALPLAAQNPPVTPPAQQPQTPPAGAPNPAAPRRPRPYDQVIPARAHTERGGVTVHRVDDRYFFEVPDSLLNRDILLLTRISGVPAGFGGFEFA